ncbi:MAG: ClbS/DfsB family four-helix bundle protein, partial [Chloroflexota bacterium]|nr:ClbS/DfsB family four-helix bundle protein [Chloroflexota bacterium]
MAEPETKAALLARIAGEHKQLEQTLDRIPTAQLVEPRLQSGWSVKDVLAHITWWERRMVQLVQGALQGQSTSP